VLAYFSDAGLSLSDNYLFSPQHFRAISYLTYCAEISGNCAEINYLGAVGYSPIIPNCASGGERILEFFRKLTGIGLHCVLFNGVHLRRFLRKVVFRVMLWNAAGLFRWNASLFESVPVGGIWIGSDLASF
jgi:hypothetical protein